MPIRYLAIVAALALSQAPPAAGADGRPGYSYVEARVDLSTTGNDTRGARSDAEGRLVGIAASWEVHESWYVKAGYSLEGKTFTNAVAGTMLSLRTKQMEITAGAGRSWALGRDTDLYAEGFVLHTRVEHDIPDVRVAERGPPTVGKRIAVLEDTGLGAAAGLRHLLDEATEVEGRIEVRDVAERTETRLALTGRRKITDNSSIGLFAAFATSTNPHIGNIAKIGAALRYEF